MNMNKVILTIVAVLLFSISVARAQILEVTHVYPGACINEQSVTALIYGNNFTGSVISAVKFIRSGHPDINGTSINVVSQEYLTCSFNLTGSLTGLYDLVVTNASGEDTLPACFTVYAHSDPIYPWVKTAVGSSSDGMRDVALGDGNGDGEIEVYGANGDHHIYMFTWNGFSWDKTDVGAAEDEMYGVALGDGDGDGEIEVYGASLDHHIYQFKWNGVSWDKIDLGSGGDYMLCVAVGDGDGDGEIEVYGANYDYHIYQFTWNGASWDKTDLGFGGTYAVCVGDGNGDGEMEVYGSHYDGNIYQFKWNGVSWDKTIVSPGLGIGGRYGVCVGDGNQDGEMEVYGAHATQHLFQFKWNGSNWLVSDLGTGNYYMRDVVVGDGNGDGEVKVYGANYDQHMMYQFEWNGSSWDKTDMGSFGNSMYGVAVGDGNNDGEMEVYGASSDNNIYQFKPMFAPDIHWYPTVHVFDTTVVGDSLDWEYLVIKNIGVDTLIVDSIIPDTTDFIVVAPWFPDTIQPGDSILVTVRFRPSGAGIIGDSPMGVYSDDPDEPVVHVILGAWAVAPVQEPHIALSDTIHDFGGVAVGDSLDWQELVIENVGSDALFVDSLVSDISDYVAVDPMFPVTILPDDSVLVTVRFSPATDDTINGTLMVYSNDPDDPMVNIFLTGVGLDEMPPVPFGLISPQDSSMLANTRPTFIWEASDDDLSGFKEYEVYIDDILRNTVNDTTWIVDYDLPEDWHSWYIVAYDSAENSRQSTETWSVLIDITAPAFVILIQPAHGVCLNDSTITFVWHESVDNLSGVDDYVLQYSLDNNFSSSVVETTIVDTTFTTVLSDTIYYWRVKARDNVANEGDWSSIWSFEIDTQIPQAPNLIAPIGGIYLNNSEVGFQWSEVQTLGLSSEKSKSSIEYILQVDTDITFSDPVAVDTVTSTFDTLLLGEGNYYWRVRAYDLASNQGPYAFPDSFGVDITAPVIESTTVWSDTSYVGPFEVEVKVTDNLSGVDSVLLYYKRNEDPEWGSIVTSPSAELNWYKSSIPSVSYSADTVRYYIEAVDGSETGNVVTDPEAAPIEYYWFIANYNPGVMEYEDIPTTFSFNLKSNPINGTVMFNVAVPQAATMTLRIYDVTGRLIEKVVFDRKSAGYYDIRGSKDLNSGIFFYHLDSPWQQKVGKLVVVK